MVKWEERGYLEKSWNVVRLEEEEEEEKRKDLEICGYRICFTFQECFLRAGMDNRTWDVVCTQIPLSAILFDLVLTVRNTSTEKNRE